MELEGRQIVSIHTIGSMYDNDCVRVVDDAGIEYRMSCANILKMVDSFVFGINKKRKHKYLEVLNEIADCY